MKIITMYELLGMVKDGKLMPERIRFENYIYIWRNTQKDYFCEQINHSLESIIGEYLFSNLNLEVEILEEEPTISKLYINNELQYDLKEEKKIPKKLPLIVNTGVNYPDDKFIERILNLFYEFNNENRLKINEIIDYLKRKGNE